MKMWGISSCKFQILVEIRLKYLFMKGNMEKKFSQVGIVEKWFFETWEVDRMQYIAFIALFFTHQNGNEMKKKKTESIVCF